VKLRLRLRLLLLLNLPPPLPLLLLLLLLALPQCARCGTLREWRVNCKFELPTARVSCAHLVNPLPWVIDRVKEARIGNA
jgi:hypothetical protein